MTKSMHICYECRGIFPKEDVKYHPRYGLVCSQCLNNLGNNQIKLKKM
jgi:hypothetical protein